MPLFLTPEARNRAVDGLTFPIRTTGGNQAGTLQILDNGDVPLVTFQNVKMFPASGGVANSTTIADTPATFGGTAVKWMLKENNGTLIISGDVGQRFKLIDVNKAAGTVKVKGNKTAIFTDKINVTLHNNTNTTLNVYTLLGAPGSSYDSTLDETTIFIGENISIYTGTWTHIHTGEAGLDNVLIAEDQIVRLPVLRITIR